MKLSELNENEYEIEAPKSEEAPLSLSSLADTDYEIESPIESKETLPKDEVTAPAVGYLAGKASQGLISKTGELAERGLEKIAEFGGTSPEQLKLIKENFPEFKATDPIDEMNKLLKTARGTNADINRMYEEAQGLLADKKITPDEYRSLVEKAALEQNMYNQPTFARPISQSEVSKTLKPAIESTQEIVKSKQQKMLEEFADLKAKEAVARASEISPIRLPEEIEDQITKNTKEQVLKNPQAFDFKGMTAQEVLPIFEEQRNRLVSEKETAKDLTEMFPSLKGTSMDPKEQAAFRKIIQSRGSADITGDRLQEILREFREVGWTEQGQLSEKPAVAMSKEIRKEIAKLSPEAGKLMEAENVELNKLEGLEKAGYVKREGAGLKTTVEMTDAQRNKLIKDLATSYDKASPTDVIENLQTLKDYLPEAEFKKLQLAGLKAAEKRGGGIDYINANKINAILQSITKRSVSRGVATIPEAISLALPKTTAIAKTIGKGAFKALPYVSAGIGGIAAQAAEEGLSPETSGATPDMPEYWLEKGYRDPEEQLRRARLSSFKRGLPDQGLINEMPTAYEQPEVKQYKEQVLSAKKLGALAPSYVEAPKVSVLKDNTPSNLSNIAMQLKSSDDKASQEYSKVIEQIINEPENKRDAILFGLNQQPAFRELIKRLKEQE